MAAALTKSDPSKISIGRAVSELYRHLAPSRRRELFETLALLFIGALLEVATIGAVVPFLALVTTDNHLGSGAGVITVIDSLARPLGLNRIMFAALLLSLIAIVSAAVRLWLSWATFRFAFATAKDMSAMIYGRVLRQPYPYHVVNNSAMTVAALDKVQQVLAYVLLPAMLALTAMGVGLCVVVALFFLNPVIATGSIVLFSVLYLFTSMFTRKTLDRNSQIITSSITKRVQSVQEGLGGIRDIILDRSQPFFLERFISVDQQFRQAQTVNYFISGAPRFVLEASSIVLIALLAMYLSTQPGGVIGALPMLGAIAVGAQRLLPLAQQVYASWSSYRGSQAMLAEVVALMGESDAPQLPPLDGPPVPFDRAIILRDISYSYEMGDGPALKHINLTIPKGGRIGLIGESGSGKSTLVDILMGLLDADSGSLTVDGRQIDRTLKSDWQRQVAHVPQNIYLADTSMAGNIAFGQPVEEIDYQRVRLAAKSAELDAYIEALPEGYATEVGERGVRMSGGQRQRLGIARALYKKASVLILDEATSALDDRTEASVMASIERLGADLTIVMIAHRVSTLRQCDTIVRIANGVIAAIGSYDEMVTQQ